MNFLYLNSNVFRKSFSQLVQRPVLYTQSKTFIIRQGTFFKRCPEKICHNTSQGRIVLARYRSKVTMQNGNGSLNTMESIKRLLLLASPERRKIAGSIIVLLYI